MNKGWILLHRQMLDCFIWESDEKHNDRSAWIDLLLLANHRDKETDFNSKPFTVKRGQYLTSVRKLSERWHWDKNKTLRYLRMLEAHKMIVKESDEFRTLLTIVNYDFYQDARDTTADTNADSTEYTNADTSVPQTKNVKNVKNENNNHIGSFGSQKVDELFAEFVKMRKQMKKPMTAHAIELAIAKLEKLSGMDTETAIKIIEQTLEHSWQTFYELKTDNRSRNQSSNPSRNQKSGTKFNDFEQTQNYDMSDLEKMLLS